MESDYTALLGKILNTYSPVAQEDTALIFDNGSIQSYSKDDIVFHENRIDQYEYFQLEGISHRFNLDSDRQRVTTGIYQNECIITPHVSRTSNQNSIFSLQALTDCTYLKVPVDIFRTLHETNAAIGVMAQSVMEREFAKILSFEVLFRTTAAKDRLLYFRANYPQLENIIPHSIIASFLGITPVSLSRLRNELTNQ